MADKNKRPPRIDLKSPDGKSGWLIQIGGTAFIVLFAVALVFYIVMSHQKKGGVAGPGDAIRVASSKLITQPGSGDPKTPKAVVSFYEDFLCPACGNFERAFEPTVSKLVDIGAIAADYTMVAILSSPRNQNYSARAAAAAYCVADESIDAFRRFHGALFSKDLQPSEVGTTFPDNAKLIEIAREAGAAGKVPDCINSGKYLSKVEGLAAAANVRATPTVKINGTEYEWSTPQALVAKIKEIVGDIPGIDAAAAAETS
ncbi:DsbA family protein [Mycobacterium simiae]|uniref:DsbA family protein n=1 Tax=Mycobacterium simiae TaxID=1784 RepID=A0A5B1BFD4_MYCSI|nr:DsbA family protein [Mycobacterium simiae]KAA1247116.1 DsbA family protein [Mycobacterium simiae]